MDAMCKGQRTDMGAGTIAQADARKRRGKGIQREVDSFVLPAQRRRGNPVNSNGGEIAGKIKGDCS